VEEVGCENSNHFEWSLPAGPAATSKTCEPKAGLFDQLFGLAWLFQTFGWGRAFSTGDLGITPRRPELQIDSGWQHEGPGSFGTAIGSQYFITASHVGGS
jgi:hypothetical protein